MRNLMNVGRVLLVVGSLTFAACSSNSGTGTGGASGSGGMTGAGGTTGSGGSNTDAGTDTPAGVGGTTGAGGAMGTGGAGGATPLQNHMTIINRATTGGIMVTRPDPVSYDSCKI